MLSKNLRAEKPDISSRARLKSYPDGSATLLVSSLPLFRDKGWEQADKWKPDIKPHHKQGHSDAIRSMRRAKANLKDIALCSSFDYFVTLTVAKDKLDRYDIKEITPKLNRWLDNRVRRNGLTYVLVPERHKDGAVHFHGFFNGALEVTDSGTMIPPDGGKPKKVSMLKRSLSSLEGCKTVFNLPAWDYGYTTAIALYGDYRRAVGYVCKYIGKSTEKIGGRWYYSGGDIHKPEVSYFDAEIRDFECAVGAYRFDVAGVASFVQLDLPPKGGGDDV